MCGWEPHGGSVSSSLRARLQIRGKQPISLLWRLGLSPRKEHSLPITHTSLMPSFFSLLNLCICRPLSLQCPGWGTGVLEGSRFCRERPRRVVSLVSPAWAAVVGDTRQGKPASPQPPGMQKEAYFLSWQLRTLKQVGPLPTPNPQTDHTHSQRGDWTPLCLGVVQSNAGQLLMNPEGIPEPGTGMVGRQRARSSMPRPSYSAKTTITVPTQQ